MLVRADPKTETISLLSFPRDLRAEIICPGKLDLRGARSTPPTRTAARTGTLETVRKLTGLPINYLITVNFRGFRQVVDKLGGIWMDVDRRYFNNHSGPNGYATINLQPGLPEAERLAGARLRALPAHRQRPLPQSRASRCSSARSRIRSGRSFSLAQAAEGDQGDHEQHRGRRGRRQGRRRQDGPLVRGASRTRCRRATCSSRGSRGSRASPT